ncbi:Basic-leucine zipper domain [Macleaya cordata]|uniref:Basic-leucine zipper domain n=1 Tax=Macleaya cordata TaxID=56857 RepID=A0A200PUL4_MACCD|nr:Basic-leucine zipper domain [Macleaya cordata]
MGNSEAETPAKTEKASSPAQEQTSVHAYPNWAAMQAYYPPGMTLPPPYFNSAVASGHPPHAFMWGTPQPMMPPYGAPYAAIYAHGGVYSHPSVPLGSPSQGHAVPSSPAVGEAMVATPLSIATPAKSSSNKDQGLMKKLKGFDGLVVSVGNGDAGSGEASQSGDYKSDGSSDGSDGNTVGLTSFGICSLKCFLMSTGEDDKIDAQTSSKPSGEANAASSKTLGVTVASVGVAGKPVGTVPSPNVKPKSITATFPPASGAEVSKHDGLNSELWIKSERELKRERRKQSNRESARRSRLRKQAETEELATKVESLNVENLSLRSEINRLAEKSEKLRLENAALLEKLKNAQLGRAGEIVSDKMETEESQPISTENFLARVNNSGSVNRRTQQESEVHENSNSGTKLHQLLESSPRTDAVVAG